MSIKTESRHPGEHIVSEANGARSRESIVINATAGILAAGTVLAKRTSANSASTQAGGGNAGNGVFGTVTAGNDAITGVYTVNITAAEADGGDFEVLDPFGNTVGTGSVGVLFEGGGLSFTIADGANDFEVGDTWAVTVTAGQGEWVAYDDDGTDDGRRTAAGILYAGVDATLADANAVAHVRDCEVDGAALTGLDAAGIADLLALGIIVR
tara:strand:+ start:1538 stop:2170 length:633 start_codon:yes stop_codon:yes gene_type:complete